MEKRTKARSSPSVGDHIFIERSICYTHHGIYVGNNKVIHYQTPMEKAHPDPKACRVIETDMRTFLGQDENWYLFRYGVKDDHAKLYSKGTYTFKQCDVPKLVVKRARQALKDGFSHYNIVGNNCEDFANYCKTGHRSMESAQFSQALERVEVARRAVANGYRSPLVYAGCVMGLFTLKDFDSPPVNRVPDTPLESDNEDDCPDKEEDQSKEMDEKGGVKDKTKDMVDNSTASTSGIGTHYNNNNNNDNTSTDNVTSSDTLPVNHSTSQNYHSNTLTAKSIVTDRASSSSSSSSGGGARKKVNFDIPEEHNIQ